MADNYGDWTIEKSIGEGGQAHIFLAKDKKGNYGVIKRLKNINRKNRFITEIESIKNDPKGFFPKIYEVNIDTDKPYFVMEYFSKGGLSEKQIQRWSLGDKCEFFLLTTLAITYAHTNKVIHRDLKPENILVSDENKPKVTDFGICFIDDSGKRETLSEEAIGSFRYMAPEMENGKSDLIGPYTDVYSLGKIAYWLFSGGKIYNRERHRDEEFDLSKLIKDNWTYHFNDFLDKATQPDYNLRIKDCANLTIEFLKIEEAIRKDYRYLDLSVNQRCSFCGAGSYEIMVNALSPMSSSVTDVRNFGFTPVGNPQWLIMVCNNCGNVQSFRKDKTRNWKWK